MRTTYLLAITAGLSILAHAAIPSDAVMAQQAMPPSKVQELMKQMLPEVPGRETRVLTIDIPPGGGTPPHRHPGHHIFGYVVDGTYRFKVGDKPEVTLKPGDTFYEAPGELHAVSQNASAAVPAKLLVVIVAESGKPITVMEK